MEVPKDDLQLALQAKQNDFEALREEFQLFKEEALEYEKELEADNQFKEKEIDSLKKKLESALTKSEENRKEIVQLEKIHDREKQTHSKIKEAYELLKNNIVKMEQDNEDLESQMRMAAFEKKEMKEKIERLEEAAILESETLTERLTQDQEEIERLRRELEEYKEEVVVLNRRRKESVAAPPEQQTEESNQNAQVILELEEQINTLENLIREKSTTIAELEKQVEELTRMLKDQKKTEKLKEELEKAVREKDVIIAELQSKIEELNKMLEGQEDLEKLTRELEKYVDEMEMIKDSHKQEIDSKETALSEQAQIADQQGKEIIELQDEIANLRTKLEEKEDKINENEENIELLVMELKAKETEATAEMEQFELIKHELERLNIELLEAMKEKQELAWKLEEENIKNTENLQESEKDREKTKQEKDKEIIFLKLELAHLKEDMTGHNEETKKLKDEVAAKNAKIKSLEDEIARPSRTGKKRQDSEDGKIRLGREDVAKIKDENASLVKENKKLKLRIANKEKEIDQLAEEIVLMRSCIEEEKDKLLAIEKDLEASRLEKTELDITPMNFTEASEPVFEKQKGFEGSAKRQVVEQKRLMVPDIRVRSVSPHVGLHTYNLTPVVEETLRERSRERSPDKSPELRNKPRLIFKHLYAKLGKNGVPPYLSLDHDKKVVSIVKGSTDIKSPRKVYKANSFDSIIHKPSDLNTKEMIEKAQGGHSDPQILGKNLFYMIYGQKKTDKKHLKYKVLQGFSETFSAIARKSEYADKVCKLIIRVQDNAINRKAEILKHSAFLQQLKSYSEFQLGTDKGEKDFEDFLTQLKQIDTTAAKSVFNYSLSKGKTNPKQIFIEFSIEKGSLNVGSKKLSSEQSDTEDTKLNDSRLSDIMEEEEAEQVAQPQEPEYLARTKIMLVCTNNIKEESYFEGLSSIDSIIDLVMTDDRAGVARKEKPLTGKIVTDNVVKHFILTTAPILQNYKSTYNTVALAIKISQLGNTGNRVAQRAMFETATTSGRPYFQINRNLAKEMDQWKETRNGKISQSQDKFNDKGSDSASSNCLDKSLNDDKPEKKLDENEEINRQMKYYSKKQEALKTNMKSVLGMLNQLISSNHSPSPNPMQKIKNHREREEEETTLKRTNVNKNSTKQLRPPSTEKTPKARKLTTRVN